MTSATAVLTPHPASSDAQRSRWASTSTRSTPARARRRGHAAHARLRRRAESAGTVVSDGVRVWVCNTNNPALATAGTGDVLTGVVASLIAQFHKRPIVAGERTVTSEAQGGLSLFDCARLAVVAHARAADAWAASRGAKGGMLASELADLLPEAVESLRAG